MTQRIVPQSYTFRDAKGYAWSMRIHISFSDADAAHRDAAFSIGDLVQAALAGTGPSTLPLTNAAFARSAGPFGFIEPFAYGTAAQYLNAEDKLEVSFFDGDGNLQRYGIGSPVAAAFLADQETGKASQLVDFVAAMTTAVTGAFVCTRSGLALVAASGSVLVRRRQRRKTFIFSKSANLDEPGE